MWESIADYYNNFQEPENYSDESDWQFMGPLGIPKKYSGAPSQNSGKGMMLSLWVSTGDHSLIYAGSHHGGLWKTTDGGDNWYPLHDNDDKIHGVNSIAVNPLNPDIIYISCNTSLGNFSSWNEGLFKSIDGGNTWEQLTLPVTYPVSDYKTNMRKVVLDPNDPNNIFLITYQDVYRSTDQGNIWTTVFHREYTQWGDESQWGLFDFKIIPWNQSVGYLAGSEIFKIENPIAGFTENNISNEIFFAGLNSADYIRCVPDRTEISIHRNYPDKVYFCYWAQYIPNDGVSFYRLRVVSYDNISQHYEVVYEGDNDVNELVANKNKLEFAVSPSNEHIFYIGGIYIGLIDTENDRVDFIAPGIVGDALDCWVHVDIRDMQLFSHNGRDTIYLANDAGISWGTLVEPGMGGQGCEWQWHHPFSSIENGLNVTEFYGIGLYDKEQDLVAGGCQDLSDMIFNNDSWINFGIGDGSEIIWDSEDRNIFYFSEWQSGGLFRTNDMGATLRPIDVLGATSPIIPMKLDPIYNSILYSGKFELIKYSGVNDFSENNQITIETLDSFAPDSLSAIEVVPASGTRKFYVSTLKTYSYENPPPPLPENYAGFIFRFKYAGEVLEFKDISSNLDGCYNGFVSDIEVDPGHISHIWVSFGVYTKGSQHENKVFYSENSGDTWEPWSEGLPLGMPVYKIKYVKQDSHYFLFALTDVGIFKSTDEDHTWYRYSNNLPAKIVTDLEINPKYNTIVAATYGRGLWKSPLLCHYNSAALEINDDITWEDDIILDRSVIIPSGKNLIIKNCRVHLPSEAKIVVERGGTLVLDNCTLTSACNDLWWGVEVQGDSRYPQTGNYQGKVIMQNYAVIEKARKAIFCGRNIEYDNPDRVYTGGIVDATDARFFNNRYGVMFWYYPFSNISTFTRCKFQTTENLADDSSPEYFMTLVQVDGIQIKGCDFEFSNDKEPDYKKHGRGIFSIDAGYTVLDYESLKVTSFRNLYYAVFALRAFTDPVLTIHNSSFEENITGVYARGIQNLSLYSNHFFIYIDKLPIGTQAYGGVYLDNCSGYLIQDNYFEGDPNPFGWNDIGITINNSGESNNLINNNTFNQLHIGTLAQNINRGKDAQQGLKFKCNVYSKNDFDIAVTGSQGCTECGISLWQGAPDEPTGNLFSLSGIYTYSDIHNEGAYLNYYHHAKDDLHPPNPWVPSYISPNIFRINLFGNPWNESYCDSNFPQGMTKSQIKSLYISFSDITDSLKNSLDQLIDGGSTEDLTMEIDFSQPEEALELQQELLSNSPFLSDTILIKSAQKEDVLPSVLVKEIMVANPQSAKSEKVMEALADRENPIPVYMIEEIMQGRDTIAQKEILEAEYSNADLQKEIALNRLISIFREDTMNTRMDSIVHLLQNHPTPSAKYRLTMTYLEMNDTLSAINTFDAIPQQFELTSSQTLIYDHWDEYIGIIIAAQKDSLTLSELDSMQIEKLDDLAQFEDQPGCLARNVLHFLKIIEVNPYYILPGDSLKAIPDVASVIPTGIRNNEHYFKLYPNPADNYLIAEYDMNGISGNGVLNIYDSSGKLKFRTDLQSNSHDEIINTKDWLCGIYLFNFISDGQYKQSGKVLIAK
ncbi:MAG: T9SS type A sorting domain-containing protein [Bacteroidales bacterium]|nr:T9SS type A sorting domain-containing protein [Bacteroidales bacterium]